MSAVLPEHGFAGRSPLAIAVRLAASIAAACLSLWIGEQVFLRQPLTTDENSYLFQAHTFSSLRLRRPAPQPPEIYAQRMVIIDSKAGWISRYPPGHSLWLTPGVWLGDERLAVALAAGVSVWFLTGCAAMLGGPVWPAALFLLACPFFLFMHGTLLSHTSGMAAVSIMLWGYMRWRIRGRPGWAALAGLAWSLLLLNRTYTALLLALPFAVDSLLCLWRAPDRRQWRGTLLFAGCAALGVLMYCGYNYLVTGSAFLTPYAFYDDGEGLGFGPRGQEFHTWGKGLGYLAGNFLLLDRWLLLGGGALWLFCLLAIAGWNRRWSPLALGAILIVPAGYVFFYCQGVNACGPFYYFETLPFFALVWMLAARRLFCQERPVLRRAAAAAGLALLIAAAAMSLRFMRGEASRISGQLSEQARLARVLRSAPGNALVIVEGITNAFLDKLISNPRGAESDPLLFCGSSNYNLIITAGLTNRAVYFLRPDHPDRLLPATNRFGFIHQVPWHRIPHLTGRPTGPADDEAAGRQASAPGDNPGYLALGHYQTAPPGRFLACFDLEMSAPAGEVAAASIDICADRGRQILAQKEICGRQARTNVCLPFDLEGFAEIEPRVLFKGGKVTFRGVRITTRD